MDVYEYVTRYKNCTGRVWDTPNDDDSFTCDKCNKKCHGYQYDNGSACPQKIPYTRYEKTGTKEQLTCGKTTETIESVIITF